MDQSKNIGRRNFTKKLGLFSAGVACAGAAFFEGCSSIQYLEAETSANQIKVLKTNFPEKGWAAVRHQNLPAGVYLSQDKSSKFTAVLMLCTHRNCDLTPVDQLLICPCHGSEFSATGTVLEPPAEKDLQKFNVTTNETHIYISLA